MLYLQLMIANVQLSLLITLLITLSGDLCSLMNVCEPHSVQWMVLIVLDGSFTMMTTPSLWHNKPRVTVSPST